MPWTRVECARSLGPAWVLRRAHWVARCGLVVVCGIACDQAGRSGHNAPGASSAASQAHGRTPEQRASDLYRGLCAACHGLDGAATSPAAASLNPRPRSFTDALWQASATDEQIKAIVIRGGQALGKSPAMPPVAALAEEPEQLDAMVRLIRSFGPQEH